MKSPKKHLYSIHNIILLIIVITLVENNAAQDVKERFNGDNSQVLKSRARAREVRGFRPNNLSTALSFGKRKDHLNALKSIYYNGQSRRYPLEWLLETSSERYLRNSLPNGHDRKNISSSRLLLKCIKIL